MDVEEVLQSLFHLDHQTAEVWEHKGCYREKGILKRKVIYVWLIVNDGWLVTQDKMGLEIQSLERK